MRIQFPELYSHILNYKKYKMSLVSDASVIDDLTGLNLFTLRETSPGCFELVRFEQSTLQNALSLPVEDTFETVPAFSAATNEQTLLPVNGGIIPANYKLLIFRDTMKLIRGVSYNEVVDAGTGQTLIEWLFPVTNDFIEYELVRI